MSRDVDLDAVERQRISVAGRQGDVSFTLLETFDRSSGGLGVSLTTPVTEQRPQGNVM